MNPLTLCDIVSAFPGLIAPGIGQFLYAFQFLRFLRVLRAFLLLDSYGFVPRFWKFKSPVLFLVLDQLDVPMIPCLL